QFARTNWFDSVPKDTVRISKEINKNLRIPAECHHELGMACGDYVLDDKKLVQDILGRLSQNEKFGITAVEMESTAVARALETRDGWKPDFLVIKAISDFAFGKSNSAQPYARATAAYFLNGFLIEYARSFIPAQMRGASFGGSPRLIIGPSKNMQDMIDEFPVALTAHWRGRAIDGAIEILRCPKAGNSYGGFTDRQILCDVNDNMQEWPDHFGGLSQDQIRDLSIGLMGSDDLGQVGWLREKGGSPGRIRVLTMPPTPPVLDRPSLYLNFANSDYFTVRSITELSRIQRKIGKNLLRQSFPERWVPAQVRFTKKCVPYHVSAQAIITCRTPDRSRYLLLASVSTAHATITAGWGATMAEQMWAPDRLSEGEPWWTEPAKPYLNVVKP